MRKKRKQDQEYWNNYWKSYEEKNAEYQKQKIEQQIQEQQILEQQSQNQENSSKFTGKQNSGNGNEESQEKPKKIKIDDLPNSQLSTQQKIWVYTRAVILASRPFLLYMLMPAVMLSIGRILFQRYVGNVTDEYIQQVMNFYTFIGISAVLIFLFRTAKKKGSHILEEVTLSFKGVNWKYIAGMLGFGFFVSLSIASIYTLLPDSWMQEYDEYSQAAFHAYDVALALISLVLLDPIAEEIVFRGYMMNRLLPRFGEKTSIVIVTVIFALCHISPLWIVYGFLFGIVLAKVSIRHDNIIYSIALHIGFNLPNLFNYLIMNSEKVSKVLYANNFLIIIYGILGAAGAYLLWRFYKKSENL